MTRTRAIPARSWGPPVFGSTCRTSPIADTRACTLSTANGWILPPPAWCPCRAASATAGCTTTATTRAGAAAWRFPAGSRSGARSCGSRQSCFASAWARATRRSRDWAKATCWWRATWRWARVRRWCLWTCSGRRRRWRWATAAWCASCPRARCPGSTRRSW